MIALDRNCPLFGREFLPWNSKTQNTVAIAIIITLTVMIRNINLGCRHRFYFILFYFRSVNEVEGMGFEPKRASHVFRPLLALLTWLGSGFF